MARDLTTMVKDMCDDVSEKYTEPYISRFKRYINKGYKELAKMDVLETLLSVAAAECLIPKPSDFYKVSKIIYNDFKIKYEEEGSNIKVPYNGEMTLYYCKVPEDLVDGESPLTNPMNDDFILMYAKYLHYIREEEPELAEQYKMDFMNFNIKAPKKQYSFTAVR